MQNQMSDHTRRRLGTTAAILAFLLCEGFFQSSSHANDTLTTVGRPNIVVILTDDQGYGDLGCYGHPHLHTPHLDRLAQQGLRLTACYAPAANCSPTRTGLLTGRTPARAGVYTAIPMLGPMHLREGEITLAGLLRDAGYATAVTGKWHVNGHFNAPMHPQPDDHGFDHWFCTQNNALPNHRNPYNFVRNGIPVGPLEGYSADLVVAEAVRWLEELRDPEMPFFLCITFHEPHEPIRTADRYRALYDFPDDPSREAYYGNVSQLDAAFGELMGAMRRLGLTENTLVFFTSDNGPARTRYHRAGSAGPLRGYKGQLWEGGIRVPGILYWPGRIRPGTVSDEPVTLLDVLPTLCELAGVALPEDRHLDGASFAALFDGQPIRRRQPLYWQFHSDRGGSPQVALRDGDWKLVAFLDRVPAWRGGSMEEDDMDAIKNAQPERFELYNLRRDIAETTDLSDAEPQRKQQLVEQLLRIYHEVREEAPVWPAWEHQRYEARRIQWPDYLAGPAPEDR
jgi:arylsulfatase A